MIYEPKTLIKLLKGFDLSYVNSYKGGSWILSDILSEPDSHTIITSAKDKNADQCMGKNLEWSDRGNNNWKVKCEDRYEYDTTTTSWSSETTTFGSYTPTATTTTDAVTTTTGSEFCCKTWIVRNGEMKSYCTSLYPLDSPTDRWVYECVTGESYSDAGKSKL